MKEITPFLALSLVLILSSVSASSVQALESAEASLSVDVPLEAGQALSIANLLGSVTVRAATEPRQREILASRSAGAAKHDPER